MAEPQHPTAQQAAAEIVNLFARIWPANVPATELFGALELARAHYTVKLAGHPGLFTPPPAGGTSTRA